MSYCNRFNKVCDAKDNMLAEKLRQLCEVCEKNFLQVNVPGSGIFSVPLKNLSIVMRAMQFPDIFSAGLIQCGATSIVNWNNRGFIYPDGKCYCHSLEVTGIHDMKTYFQPWALYDNDLFMLADLRLGLRNVLFAGSEIMLNRAI